MTEGWPDRPAAGLPDHVTTPLLTRITEGSLDADYRQVALRRAGEARPPRPGGRHLVATSVIAVFGVLVTTAAVQTSQNSDIQDASRNTLIERVKDRRALVAAQQQQMVELQDQNIDSQADLDQLTAQQQAELARQERLEVRTGFVAVTGDGVRVTIADPPDAGVLALVHDEDLALLVNGLFSAGAEAIAINGQRLTVLTAIRNSGLAINVNSRPLTAPYVVSAIGNQDTLQADLLDTALGARFFDVADQFGFGVTMQNVDDLELPALRGPRLEHAQRGTAGKPGLEDEEANP